MRNDWLAGDREYGTVLKVNQGQLPSLSQNVRLNPIAQSQRPPA